MRDVSMTRATICPAGRSGMCTAVVASVGAAKGPNGARNRAWRIPHGS